MKVTTGQWKILFFISLFEVWIQSPKKIIGHLRFNDLSFDIIRVLISDIAYVFGASILSVFFFIIILIASKIRREKAPIEMLWKWLAIFETFTFIILVL